MGRQELGRGFAPYASIGGRQDCPPLSPEGKVKMTFSSGEGGNRLRRLTEEAFFPCIIPTEAKAQRVIPTEAKAQRVIPTKRKPKLSSRPSVSAWRDPQERTRRR